MSQGIPGYVVLTLSYHRDGYKWVGICLELGTSTFARTLKQCQEELEELVAEHLEVLEESGERERFFQRWGIEIRPQKTTPQELVIRGSGDEWDRLFQSETATSGPFLQPRIFPLDGAARKDPQLAGV